MPSTGLQPINKLIIYRRPSVQNDWTASRHHQQHHLTCCLDCCNGSVDVEGATTQRWSSVAERERERERATSSGVVRGSRGVTALYHCFLDKITVMPLLSEGNYSFASVTEKMKRYLAHKVLPLPHYKF